jgi:pyrroline-5-carboxylate reductase
VVAEPDARRREWLEGKYAIRCSEDNAEAANASICVIAIKPQILKSVLCPLSGILKKSGALLVSVAAGVTLGSLDRWSGGGCAIIRAMPNTPALIGCGATAMISNSVTDSGQRREAEAILGAVGTTTWLDDESMMDVVTALSGSGPAYFFLVMDALCKAAVAHGLDAATARELCTQTALGAASLARSSEETLERLRRNVTSPGGTTERGVAALEDGGLVKLFEKAIDSARIRSLELAKELGDES